MKKKRAQLVEKRNRMGYAFIALWLIGITFFFIRPVFQTLMYAFSEVTVNTLATKFIGFENFRKAFFTDPNYNQALVASLLNMLYEVPVIVLFSMFIAGILNQEFKGRTFARILFFLPVIIASGVSIQILSANGMSTDIAGQDTMFSFKTALLEKTLTDAGLAPALVAYFSALVNNVFGICWKSGIQILLFLAGLQTIPKSYYEVSSLEGATAWDEFWKVTFPLLSPYTLVCVVYTIIDSFTYYQNGVMMLIKTAYDSLNFGYSSAQAWVYFVVILLIIILVNKVIFRKIVYVDE